MGKVQFRDIIDQKRIKEAGCKSLSDLELLTLILNDAEAAITILNEYSLAGLTRLDIWRLEKSVAPRIARKAMAAIEFGKRCVTAPVIERKIIETPGDAALLLLPEMQCLTQEEMRIVLLDNRLQLISIRTVQIGTHNELMLRGADLIRPAIIEGATQVILAHNHTSGVPEPSPEDIEATEAYIPLFMEMDIPIRDHLIIGAGTYVSLKAIGVSFDYHPNKKRRRQK